MNFVSKVLNVIFIFMSLTKMYKLIALFYKIDATARKKLYINDVLNSVKLDNLLLKICRSSHLHMGCSCETCCGCVRIFSFDVARFKHFHKFNIIVEYVQSCFCFDFAKFLRSSQTDLLKWQSVMQIPRAVKCSLTIFVLPL